MTTTRTYRLEFHSEGQALLLEKTSDPERARDILDRHIRRFEQQIDQSVPGRLVLYDEISGQVLARKTLRERRGKRASAPLFS